MTEREWALLFHLAGVVLLFSGLILAAAALAAARRREVAGEIAALLGLTRFGEPVFGMMHQPFTGERFAGDGGAAHYRGPAGNRDLRVRPCASLAEAFIYTTSPLLMNGADRESFRRV